MARGQRRSTTRARMGHARWCSTCSDDLRACERLRDLRADGRDLPLQTRATCRPAGVATNLHTTYGQTRAAADRGRRRRGGARGSEAGGRPRRRKAIGNRKKRKGERKKKATGARMLFHRCSLSSTGCNRSAMSYGLISPNQRVFWQNAPKWVSVSKGPSLWMSNRQLSLAFMVSSAQEFVALVVSSASRICKSLNQACSPE